MGTGVSGATEAYGPRVLALLREAAARTVSALWAAIGALLKSFEPDECANHLRHAGYGST